MEMGFTCEKLFIVMLDPKGSSDGRWGSSVCLS